MKSKSIYLLITLFYFTLSCSTNNLEEETTGKTLGFKTTLAKELVLPIGITNINDSYQPFGSNSVFFLNEHSKRSEEHTSELQSRPHLVCRLLLEKKNLDHLGYEP